MTKLKLDDVRYIVLSLLEEKNDCIYIICNKDEKDNYYLEPKTSYVVGTSKEFVVGKITRKSNWYNENLAKAYHLQENNYKARIINAKGEFDTPSGEDIKEIEEEFRVWKIQAQEKYFYMVLENKCRK